MTFAHVYNELGR